MAENYEKNKLSDDESKKIVEQAKKHFKLCEQAESEQRKVALEDLEFSIGNHWPNAMKIQREKEARPTLTVNKLPQQIRQVTNDQRQNRPAIKVSPVDSNADIETAKILQGIIRHIEYNSNAEAAYDNAFEGAVRKSFGFFRVITDYATPTSFNQEIFIKKIRNHFMVHLDPYSKELDGSDANFAIIEELVPKEQFDILYKDFQFEHGLDWKSSIGQSEGWIQEDACRVAEYFVKEPKEVTLYLLEDGTSVTEDKFIEGMNAIDKRKTKINVICWYKIVGNKVSEKTEWAGQWIPIIPVYGDEIDVNGKVVRESLIRHAKDSQLMYDFMVSSEAEAIALSPKAPFIATQDQIEGFEADWQSANRKNHAILKYNNVSTTTGQPLPPPSRSFGEPAVNAISQARMLAAEDIKATTGIYDASLGAKSNETSGVAIMGRQRQSQTNNFHFVDNLTHSIRHCGRILLDLIPKIYDTAQVMRIIGEDGEQKTVPINQPFMDEKTGIERIYDLSIGRYDVVVQTGPSYATKRQESLATMIELSKVAPQVMQVAGDLLVKNMDWEQAQEIAERLKKTIPPNILGDENAAQPQIPQEVQAQMQQMDQMIQQLQAKLQESEMGLEKTRLEIESRERIEAAKLDNQLHIEAAKLNSKEQQMIFQQQFQEIQRWQDQVNQFLNLNETGQEMPESEQNDNYDQDEMMQDQGMVMQQMSPDQYME